MSDHNYNPIFGETQMGSYIADIGDLSNTLRGALGVTEFPEDPTVGTIVQLEQNIVDSGITYISGHYYQYLSVDDVLKWVDVTAYINKVKTVGFGYYYWLEDSRQVTFVWTDPVSNEDGHNWIGTKVLIVDRNSDTEEILTETTVYNRCVTESGGVTITLDDDGIDIADLDFVAEYSFSDGTSSRYTFQKVTDLAGDTPSVVGFQADWAEQNPNNVSYIRNKPLLIRKIYLSDNNELMVVTDDPVLSNRIRLTSDGELVIDGVVTVNLGNMSSIAETAYRRYISRLVASQGVTEVSANLKVVKSSGETGSNGDLDVEGNAKFGTPSSDDNDNPMVVGSTNPDDPKTLFKVDDKGNVYILGAMLNNALKEYLESASYPTLERIDSLSSTASTTAVRNKVNELITNNNKVVNVLDGLISALTTKKE